MRSYIPLLLCLGLAPGSLHGQQPGVGIVFGTVRDSAGPLLGARVSIEGTNRTAVTDGAGRYHLAGVPAGEHVIVARLVGHAVGRRPATVPANDSVQVVFQLAQLPVELDAVVVTATREAAAKATTPATIGVVDSADVATARPHHSAEVTNHIPGVLVVDLGGEGHTMALRLPINYSPVYEYLEDGVPIRSTGFFNHNALYEVNVPQAGRIEVFKGPPTALYGSDAIGGVVNVLTQEPSATPAVEMFAEGGRYGYGRALGSATRTWGANGVRADVNVTHFDGWRDNAYQNRQSGTLRWDSRLNDHARLKTVVAFANIDSPGDGGSDLSSDEFENHPEKNYTPIATRAVGAFRLSSGYLSTSERSLVDVTAYTRYNSLGLLPSWQLTYDPQIWNTHNYSGGLLAKYRRSFTRWDASVILGADVDYSPGKRVEDEIIPTQVDGVFTTYALGERQYDYNVTFRGISPYVHAEASPLPRLRLSAGVRFDQVGYDYENLLSVVDTGGHRRPASTSVWYSHTSPKVGLTYQFSDAVNGFASYRHGFRVPSEDQLFVQGSAENTVDLRPVRANSYEAGIRATLTHQVSLEWSAYRMDVTDDILTFYDTLTFTSATSNAGRTRHWGVEAGAGFTITRRVRLEAAYAYVRHRYLEWVTATGVDYSGNEMESAPRHIANTRLTFTPGSRGGIVAEWTYVGWYFTDPENAHRYGGYNLLNLYCNTPLTGGFSLVGRVNNVTNARYAVTASFNPFVATNEQERFTPGMPLSVFLGFQYDWRR